MCFVVYGKRAYGNAWRIKDHLLCCVHAAAVKQMRNMNKVIQQTLRYHSIAVHHTLRSTVVLLHAFCFCCATLLAIVRMCPVIIPTVSACGMLLDVAFHCRLLQ